MSIVKTHKFGGRRYHIYMGKLYGSTMCSRRSELELLIRTDKCSERNILDTTIHEALHACDWDKSEKKVERTAKDISRFLWRLGYRR